MIFIDTNLFLRFFLKDIHSQYLEAKETFKKGSRGEEILLTSTVVIFEFFWVLNSYYHYSRSQLNKTIHDVLSMTFIQLSERTLLQEALELYERTNLSLGDCYNLVYAKQQKIKTFKTFDKKLEKEFEKIVGKKV